ncbi:MAG: STAS-like domain-containing protein [Anaerolineae bacterium]|nr:STAS-like domain-containing protein [Anaerolineae bacterium]
MSEQITISVFEIVGSPLCVASEDGQKVFERLELALRNGRRIVLSFHNVTGLTSAFLNAAIGQLYGIFDEQTIRSHLSVSDVSADDLVLLKRVVDTAKLYFKDPERFRQTTRDVLGDEDDEE